jgi:hypothetical protein
MATDLLATFIKDAIAGAAASPAAELGSQVLSGNVAGGLEGFAQSQLGPQMNFIKSLGDPNASSMDAFMKMGQNMRAVGMPQIAPLSPMQTGPVGVPNQTPTRMQMPQGLPQGLIAQMGYRR